MDALGLVTFQNGATAAASATGESVSADAAGATGDFAALLALGLSGGGQTAGAPQALEGNRGEDAAVPEALPQAQATDFLGALVSAPGSGIAGTKENSGAQDAADSDAQPSLGPGAQATASADAQSIVQAIAQPVALAPQPSLASAVKPTAAGNDAAGAIAATAATQIAQDQASPAARGQSSEVAPGQIGQAASHMSSQAAREQASAAQRFAATDAGTPAATVADEPANIAAEALKSAAAQHAPGLSRAIEQSEQFRVDPDRIGTTEATPQPGPTVHAALTQPSEIRPATPEHSALLSVAAPVSDAGFADDLSRQVVWMVDKDAQVAELRINPPELGPVEVRLTLTDEGARAQFVSPHAEVREAIENAIARLREALAQAGVQLGEASVSAESFSGRAETQPQGRNSQDARAADRLSMDALVPTVNRSTIAGRGLVDVFA